MKLLLFNPETEYALASGASFYTPPAAVEKMRRERQLLPEAWAKTGDMILVDNAAALKSDFKLVDWSMLSSLFAEFPEIVIEPWGWNKALVRKFLDHGVPESALPSEAVVNLITQLAHRSTTVTLSSRWNAMVEDPFKIEVPVELTSIDDCMDFYRANLGCWMKAPWSSSGRGVINTAADMTPLHVEQWCRGILRRQGSVMGETGADRIADFATEWNLSEGKAHFLGLSSFYTSNRGKYISNDAISQKEMRSRFDSISSIPIDYVIFIQRIILQDVLQGYEGLCGVDMLIERNGHLRPFVELNLRRTMGMLYCLESLDKKF